jgi:hypothetical protein
MELYPIARLHPRVVYGCLRSKFMVWNQFLL